MSADTREKPYACHCGQSFTRRDLLTRHQRLHHVKSTPTSTATSSLQTPHTPLDHLSGVLPAPDPGSGWDFTQEISDFLTNAGLDLDFDIDDFIHHNDIADASQSPWHGVGCSAVANEPGPSGIASSATDDSTETTRPTTRIPVMSTGDG